MSIKPTPDAENLHYDREILPTETGERLKREGENFQETPEPAKDPSEGHIDTTKGYTVDREGLANNYAIEPEMYYEVPGDRREKKEALEQQRAEEVETVNETDEDGKLEVGEDRRGKGPGLF
ncbi:hypothetical protein CKA32_004639 [Geitlerinema sp. FC II]|uniref:hypothetical protein n=1 Tax=Baaleninema simplex TaxID=2862350 RepID=UPI00034675D7|nr:hypothetical protein [Baaleninema simplex]MDC0832418.1 hypothetical protein [Geitlerinema sp. CS-897]PPT07467.1 hypothetical protein CKA32_004639 [Geitlerinema sp. FC II]